MDNTQRSQEKASGLPGDEGGAGRRNDGGQKKQEEGEGRSPSNQPQVSQSAVPAPPVTHRPGELPQCMLGNRKVDDMSFMISCTNWY